MLKRTFYMSAEGWTKFHSITSGHVRMANEVAIVNNRRPSRINTVYFC